MIDQWETWAVAQELIKQHGGKAPVWIAKRVADFTSRGDHEGVATWRAIADRVDQLTDFRGTGRARH